MPRHHSESIEDEIQAYLAFALQLVVLLHAEDSKHAKAAAVYMKHLVEMHPRAMKMIEGNPFVAGLLASAISSSDELGSFLQPSRKGTRSV